MDFGRIVGDAWRLTWRHRFLWWFALLGGAQSGGCSFNYGQGFQLPSSGAGQGPRGTNFPGGPDVARIASQIGTWIAEHLPLVVAGGLVLFLIALALVAISFVARGALIASSARVALAEPTTTRDGWALGRRFGWRYVRLTLLLILLVLATLLTIGVVALLLVLLAQVSRLLAILLGIVLGLAAVAALIAVGVAASIVVAYAERAIALDDLGARAAVRRGIALLRLQLGTSLLVWLVSLALGIAIAIAIGIVLAVALLPLGGIVVAAYATSGLSAQTLLAGLFGALVLITLLWVAGAIAGTFTSSYWTLTYLNLTGRYPPPAA